ncbi:acyl-CoA thioesterase [Granulibacter bethesdensis]|uniref:Acyl-CoA hydrolase n=1 Tax=Granulibacter bethesdensis (strain ATCC BAA-1260 / CGDNIH1) TaxID=391165 RepID=Q0BPJ4_GRABC|nr:acyl-CoA thioesterase [Granulibacter bethesdensis]ABI63258.1 Acyl-CoA hydrolase [Granulibacter bethesdensis CGDNIH1]AHJ66895.1 Acyl-CoA hydrolase [Granulibacter bethesdensis CGDNIH4]AHJ69565.1 Acyl-CoA hydrolase [Granulibacter bethesdensis]APH53139.1 Acyl-CoA hydrolase [Granulibacter bethesdensis]APH65828.1 Acyl-CoA hydrolase [Granulibacter bethesdensis]
MSDPDLTSSSRSADPELSEGEGPPAEPPMIRTIAMPADTNPAGDIFGGWLMSLMDMAAGNVATRYARGRCVTVAVDSIAFLAPVVVGDEVSLYAKLLSTGRSSMRIAVEAWRRPRVAEDYRKVTRAVFVFVAIDENRRARPLPTSTLELE